MNIIVTGSHGFIGSHLCERLLKDGHNVLGIDDLSMGKMENLPDHQNLRFVLGSILDDGLGIFFDDIDIVYHLAALTRPQESFEIPEKFEKVNCGGTIKILRHCRDHNVGRIVFMSSTSAYGTQKLLPTPETAPFNPMSPYALTKMVGEEYCKLFAEVYKMQINRIRPFNVYGTRQDPYGGYAAAIPKFIDQLSKGETPYITGDGKQSRDFIYIDDLVDLLVRAGESEVYGEAFNAGSGVSTSINIVYKLIREILGLDTEPDYVAPVFEPPKTLGDIGKANKLLGWTSEYDLESGLIKMIKEMK